MSIDRAKAQKAAQKYLAKGQIDRAISEYERMAAADPADARSLLKLGDLYTRRGDNKSAASTYRKVAEQYAEHGFFLKGVAVYKQILKLDPSDLRATESLGEMYELLSLASDALATFEQVAEAHIRAGRPDKAINALGKVATLDRENVSAWVRYAEALSKADRIDEAADAFRQGADLLKGQGRLDDYIKVTERLLFHSHEHIDRALELAGLYIERGQSKAALAHLQTCFKADPRSPATLALLARAFQGLGQQGKAVSVYRELARIHAGAGEAQDEAQALRLLLELEPSDATAKARLAQLPAAEAGAADDSFEEVVIVEDEPETASIRPSARPSAPPANEMEREAKVARLMAECEVFVRYGLRDKVVTQLKRVIELEPDHLEAHEKLKEAHVKRGEIDAAVAVLVRLSDILVAVDPEKSRAYLEEGAALNPDHPEVVDRLGGTAEAEDDDGVVFVDDEEDADAFPDLAESAAPALAGADEDDGPELVLEAGDEDKDENEDLPEAVAEALEEADFYLPQDLLDEAREILTDALGQFPNHPALLRKLAELDAGGAPGEARTDQSFALAEKLAGTAEPVQGPVGVNEVLSQFKAGVKRQVDKGDTATHYDLGIAYMEMGLHDEAIEEFRMCLESSDRKHTAHTMIGLSHVAKGDMTPAIAHFKQALASPGGTPAEETTLWFEIGNASELLGKSSEALVWYEKVEEREPSFRDVAARIERLGTIKTAAQEVDEFDEMFDNMIIKD